jgi:hypothetical protein
MIILVEPDRDVRKNLADLMSRERIIGVDSIEDCLQLFLKFKNDLDLIIANVNLLSEMLSKQLIERVCEKLSIGIPPVIAIYKKSEEETRDVFLRTHKGYKLIRYAENDIGFPSRYLEVIKKACPGLVIDYEKAREAWHKRQQPSDFIDPRVWLEEEGFLDVVKSHEPESSEKTADDIVSSIQTLFDEDAAAHAQPESGESEEDYKKMYSDLKEKYDTLLKAVRAFMESVTKTET